MSQLIRGKFLYYNHHSTYPNKSATPWQHCHKSVFYIIVVTNPLVLFAIQF